MPWMAPIATPDGKDVVAVLPATEVPPEEKLQEGDCVRAMVLRMSDLSSVTLTLDATKLSRFQSDGEVHLRVGRITGMQGLGAPCGKYNIAIMSEGRLQREDKLADLHRLLGLSGFESVLLGREIKEFLARPPLDMQAIRSEQEAHACLLHVLQGAAALQMRDPAVAHECFSEALQLAPAMREAHLGMGRVLRMLGQEDKAAEHERLAGSAKTEAGKGHPLLKILTEPASSPAAASPAPVGSGAGEPDGGELRKNCPVCDALDHAARDCPYLLCSKCRMWGHLPVYCQANAVHPPQGVPPPQSLSDWEAAVAERNDESAWHDGAPAQAPSRVRSPQARPEEKRRLRDSGEEEYRERDRRGGGSGGRDGHTSRMVCRHCGAEDHTRSECPLLHRRRDDGGEGGEWRHGETPRGGGRMVRPPPAAKRPDGDRRLPRSRSRSRSPRGRIRSHSPPRGRRSPEPRKSARTEETAFCVAFLNHGVCKDLDCQLPHISVSGFLAAIAKK